MEKIEKQIQTRNGGTVSLIKPENGRPFFRYLAGAVATNDSFRYVIRQHGQEDTATVNIQVNLPQTDQSDDQKDFNNALKGFLNCVDAFMDGTPSTMALTNLLGIDEGDVLNDDWMQKVFSSFRYIDYAKEAEALEFEQHYGQYYYMAGEGYWEYEPGGNSAVLHFPSSPKSGENDAEWVINYIKTIPRKTESGFYHLPVSVDTQFRIDGKLLLSFNINNVQYLEGTAIPLYADIEVVAWPYVLRVNLKSNDQREFIIRGNITDEKGGCQLDIDTTWHVNQDLREKLDEKHIHMVQGHLNLNDIGFTNLNSLWEAAKTNIEDQAELDKLVNIDCLLKGKKIGNVRYIIKEEILELTYLNGTRQNISDIVIEHFKQYFNEPKPTGEIRNNALDLRAHSTFRATATPITTIADSRKKTSNNLTQAIRRRTIRNGASLTKIGESIARFFRVEEEKPYNPMYGYPGIPDLPGSFTPIPDLRTVNPEPRSGLINPGVIKPGSPLVTPEDKPELRPKPGIIKSPTVKPPKVADNQGIKHGTATISPSKTKGITDTQPGVKTKGGSATIKPQPGVKTKGGTATTKAQPGAKTRAGAATIKAQPGAKTKAGTTTIKAQPGAKTKGGTATIKAQPGAKTKGGTATIKAQPGAKTKGGTATIKAQPGAKTKGGTTTIRKTTKPK